MKRILFLITLLLGQWSYASKIIYMTKGTMYSVFTEPCLRELRDVLAQIGYELRQADSLDNLGDFAFLIHTETPTRSLGYPKEKMILFIQEPLTPNNHNPAAHQQFSKIITWNDSLIDGKRYFKYYFYRLGHLRNAKIASLADKKKLCILVNANKMYPHENQLYTARNEAIKFFDQYPKDFDLYGPGWDSRKFKTYKGILGSCVEDKIEAMKQYKFHLCYENVAKMPGYVSEKIFHCLRAGCVPIYWGAPNVTDIVPETCFINRENFRNDRELYQYMKNMPDAVYQKYLDNIQNYLTNDPRVDLVSTDHFISVFLHVLFGKN
jgi:alpha(1,3/1,4) fucosyltransferase